MSEPKQRSDAEQKEVARLVTLAEQKMNRRRQPSAPPAGADLLVSLHVPIDGEPFLQVLEGADRSDVVLKLFRAAMNLVMEP